MTPARDRFEAMVKKERWPINSDNPYVDFHITEKTALKLLRREHATLVRAVRKQMDRRVHLAAKGLPWEEGYVVACEDVLALLATRKGRKG